MKNKFDFELENYTDYDMFKDMLDSVTAKKFNILSEEWRLTREMFTLKSGYWVIIVGFFRKWKVNQRFIIGHNKPKRPVFYCIFDEKYDNYESGSCFDFIDFFAENVKKAENYKELMKILEDK